MTWQIKKLSYSHAPWRLVNDSGEQATILKTFDHPHIGKTQISGPVCGQTKEELIGKVLQIVDNQRAAIQDLRQRIKELTK